VANIDFSEFQRLAAQFDKIPVARTLFSDGLTPVLALRRLGETDHACLFESVVGGEKVGRYSFLGVDPHTIIRVYGTRVTIESQGNARTVDCPQPMEFLRQQVTQYSVAPRPDLPPLTGGAIGYFGYDVVRYYEKLPQVPPDDRQLPDLAFGLFDQLVVFDHVYKTLSIIVLASPARHATPEAAYQSAQQELDLLTEPLGQFARRAAPAGGRF
jgi:anthranilate synthase component I